MKMFSVVTKPVVSGALAFSLAAGGVPAALAASERVVYAIGTQAGINVPTIPGGPYKRTGIAIWNELPRWRKRPDPELSRPGDAARYSCCRRSVVAGGPRPRAGSTSLRAAVTGNSPLEL